MTPERTYCLYCNKLLLNRKNIASFKQPLAILFCLASSLGKLTFLLPTFKSSDDIKAALMGLFDGIRGVYGPTFKAG